MKMPDKVYDILKYVALIVMPALAVLVTAITEIWHIPYGPEISGTITALDVCLGSLLQVSNAKYRKENA